MWAVDTPVLKLGLQLTDIFIVINLPKSKTKQKNVQEQKYSVYSQTTNQALNTFYEACSTSSYLAKVNVPPVSLKGHESAGLCADTGPTQKRQLMMVDHRT